jgi:hypothetical protein
MELLGQINDRQIHYTNIRKAPNWSNTLPNAGWLVFTIEDTTDRSLLVDVVNRCLGNAVCYTCSAGELGSLTEDLFDGEIADRANHQAEKTGISESNDLSPMTTYHKNFGEGFWFASTVANDDDKHIDSVVCIDFTAKGVKRHLAELITKINSSWLPFDEEIEEPMYDN